jgi:integrase
MGEPAKMTLGEAVDRYFDSVIFPKGKPEAAKRELYALNVIRGKLGAATPLRSISAAKLSELRDGFLKDGLKPATAKRYLSILQAIMRKANREWNALPVVPPFPKTVLNNQRVRWLTDDEEKRLLAASPPHLRDLLVFLLDTGARLREATRLTWTDVDLEAKPRAAVKFMTTKSGKPRGVPLTERATHLLKRLLKERPEGEPRVFLYRPTGPKGGQPTKAKPFERSDSGFLNACKTAKVADFKIHDCRHTYASRLVRRGVPLLDVSKLLGHSTLTMTLRYAHLAPDALNAAVAKLDAA